MRLPDQQAIVTIHGGDLEHVVAVLNGQPFVEIAEGGQLLGENSADQSRNVGIFDQLDAVGFASEVGFDTAPESEKPTCNSSTSRRK